MQIGSKKSKMATAEPELTISRLVEHVALKFQLISHISRVVNIVSDRSYPVLGKEMWAFQDGGRWTGTENILACIQGCVTIRTDITYFEVTRHDAITLHAYNVCCKREWNIQDS